MFALVAVFGVLAHTRGEFVGWHESRRGNLNFTPTEGNGTLEQLACKDNRVSCLAVKQATFGVPGATESFFGALPKAFVEANSVIRRCHRLFVGRRCPFWKLSPSVCISEKGRQIGFHGPCSGCLRTVDAGQGDPLTHVPRWRCRGGEIGNN